MSLDAKLTKTAPRALARSNPDGSVDLRLRIPRGIWEIAVAYGLKMRLKPEHALEFVFDEILSALASGTLTFFSQSMREAAANVKAANFGVAAHVEKIDLGKLHTSTKTKSGYEGVYANGKGFRAMGRKKDSPTPIYLGQFETAEAAAWHRYLHYKQESLPYGELEKEVDRYRAQFGDTRSDADIIATIREDSERLGLAHIYFPPEANEPTAKPLCALCDKPIDPVDMTADTPKGIAHNGCAKRHGFV